jgi:hypothetical protein
MTVTDKNEYVTVRYWGLTLLAKDVVPYLKEA